MKNTILFQFAWWSRLVLFFILDTAVMLTPRRTADLAVIVRLDAIGDFMVWLQSGAADLVCELRRRNSKVILLANTAWALLASELNLWDEVVTIDPSRFMRNPFYRIKKLYVIRTLGAKEIVQPRAARVFLQEDEIVRISGANTRVGSSALIVNISRWLSRLSDRIYSRIIIVSDSILVHESVRNRSFSGQFCKESGKVVQTERLGLPRGFKLPECRYAVFAPGAGSPKRRWGIEKFATVANFLREEFGLLCVVVGSGADADLATLLSKRIETPIKDFTGRLSLTQTAQVIMHSALLISNESGPLHMGVWCGIPTIGLLGGGHFGWFAPYPEDFQKHATIAMLYKQMPCYGCNWHCIFEVANTDPVPCVQEITISEVISAARRLLTAAS